MTKRFITLFIAIVMIATLFTGCEGETTIITGEKTDVGSYSMFETCNMREYLSFLENLDETKYEIIDISTSMGNYSKYEGSAEFYMVTYKKIAE